MKKWPLFLASAMFIGCGFLAQRSPAQTREIFPPRSIMPPFPRPFPSPLTALELQAQNAKIEISGPLARTHLRQTLRNNSDRALEGSYLFALPPGAAVSNFAMTMNGKRLESEILEGDKAREIYTGIVQKMRDPAILEFLDRDLVRAKIFPVAAGGTVEIELDYAQTVAGNRFQLPLRAPLGQNAPDARTSVEIALSGDDVRAVYSPTHSVEARHQGGKTLVSGEFSSQDRDFSLLWTRGNGKISLDMLTTAAAGEDGTFLLLAAPDPSLSPREIEAKDVVFVCDTSGSMAGEKIEQTRRALKTLLGNLNPKDRFDIITFASSVQNFRDELTPATPANLDAARAFAQGIKAVGGTNISDALQSALSLTKDSSRPQQIVFMTDGQPTVGETSAEAILGRVKEKNGSKARLFVFGVGYDVNARLLDNLAEENRGTSDYVTPQEDIEVKVGALYEKIAFPVLSNAKIDYGAMNVYDVYPPQLPDLFRGSQVAVFGRFRGHSTGKVGLSGQNGGQNARFDGVVTSTEAPEMPKLWATRKVGYLLDDARRAGRPIDGEVRDEIIKLSQKYGIVTPLTAALITEDGALPRDRDVRPMTGDLPILGQLFRNRNGAPTAPAAERGAFGGGPVGLNGLAGSSGPTFADSGAAGVAASKATQSLREGRGQNVGSTKTIEGKTFALQNGIWTDSEIDAKKQPEERKIAFASPEYFALLKNPKLAKWLSVGDRVWVMWQGQILKIEP